LATGIACATVAPRAVSRAGRPAQGMSRVGAPAQAPVRGGALEPAAGASAPDTGVPAGAGAILSVPARAPQGGDAERADALSRALQLQVHQARRLSSTPA
ncbi:MAG TPA: hypothetical protein VF832_02525, partial [Longimicrobiales bacterium]